METMHCPRCDGTGHTRFEFAQGVCFRCNGTGRCGKGSPDNRRTSPEARAELIAFAARVIARLDSGKANKVETNILRLRAASADFDLRARALAALAARGIDTSEDEPIATDAVAVWGRGLNGSRFVTSEERAEELGLASFSA